MKDAGTEKEAQVIVGRYSYTAPDGTPVQSNWYGDETGFHVGGANFQDQPSIPDEYVRSSFLQRDEKIKPV